MTTRDDTRISSWKLLARNPVTLVSALVLAAVAVVAVFAQALAPYGINDVDVPNALHWIDKYTQIPTILGPVADTIDALDDLVADFDQALAKF